MDEKQNIMNTALNILVLFLRWKGSIQFLSIVSLLNNPQIR